MEAVEVNIETKDTENSFKDGNEVEDTTEKMARRYYDTRSDAESKRRKGERIYYKAGEGYYIVRPKKRDWWNIF